MGKQNSNALYRWIRVLAAPELSVFRLVTALLDGLSNDMMVVCQASGVALVVTWNILAFKQS